LNDLCYVNGRIVPVTELVLRADDAGFQLGLSVFDTVLFENGCFYFLEQHLERLGNGAADLSIELPPREVQIEALVSLQRALGTDSIAMRMTLTRGTSDEGPTFMITVRPVVRPSDPGIILGIARDRRMAGDPMSRLKSTNRLPYILAREQVIREGAWEALFLSHEGDAMEGTISNFFCVSNGALKTAAVERGCLPGTIRALLIDEISSRPLEVDGQSVGCEVGRVTEADLLGASEMFMTNTTGRILPVSEVRGLGPERAENRALPGSSGPVVGALWTRVLALEESYRAAQLKNGIGAQNG